MTEAIHPDTRIGLVSLSVADLGRSLSYYENGIGLRLLQRDDDEATLGAGRRPLLHLRRQPGAQPTPRATGLYHFALLVPSRHELSRTLRHLMASEAPVGGASDHVVSEALYLTDPDGHGIEIYRDRPRDDWYDAAGNFLMTTKRMDVAGVLATAEGDDRPWAGLHPDTVMGHIHLQVAHVQASLGFYAGVLGFANMTDAYPGAAFVSAGGYHHHIGLNTWHSAGAAAPPPGAARLLAFDILLPDAAALDPVLQRLEAAGRPAAADGEAWTTSDPSANRIRLRVAGNGAA